MPEIVIDRRFRGPPNSGNGGYVCGAIAAHIGPTAEITLRRPIPLERPLRLSRDENGARLLAGDDDLLAEGRALDAFDVSDPAIVSFDEARRASDRAAECDHTHPLPGCFVCGPERAVGDGLRLRTATLASGVLAAPWQVPAELCAADGNVDAKFVWSVLDCPTGFAAVADMPGRPILLGRLAACIRARPAAGERCVVTAWNRGSEGRKLYAEAALFGEKQTLLAVARATWFVVSREAIELAGT